MNVRPLLLFFLAAGALLAPAPDASGAKETVWKPVEGCILKLEGRAVKTWNVYRAEKNNRLLLVQLGRRYLILDTKERWVQELAPSDVKAHGKDFVTSSGGKRKPIPSGNWVTRDVGPAELIRVRLMDYGKVLEVQVPHPYNFRVAY
jgi:hypothetical protein